MGVALESAIQQDRSMTLLLPEEAKTGSLGKNCPRIDDGTRPGPQLTSTSQAPRPVWPAFIGS